MAAKNRLGKLRFQIRQETTGTIPRQKKQARAERFGAAKQRRKKGRDL